MRYCLLLVEGQTEERFVKEVLVPHFEPRGLYTTPTLLTTKKVKHGPNFKGGITSFAKFEGDLHHLLNGAGPDALVTTIVDYYGLPDDFPAMHTRSTFPNAPDRVRHVETALRNHFSDRRFLPFLSLHEFEAWIFASRDTLPTVIPDLSQQAAFAKIYDQYPNPEMINERPGYNPAARIRNLFPGYGKVLHGVTTTRRIGLDAIRTKCPHFAQWIAQIEHFAEAP